MSESISENSSDNGAGSQDQSQASSTPIIPTTSAAYARKRIDGRHTLFELPLTGKINLRANPEDKALAKALKSVTGCDLPLEVNTLERSDTTTVYCLGPDEWQIQCLLDQRQALQEVLDTELGDMHHSLTDVSDYYAMLRLEGPEIANVLSRGCPQDLRYEVFSIDHCTQTRFGHASVLIDRVERSSFDIQIRWSYAEYVWDYLASAMSVVDL